jgi:hypothetical protein
MKRRLPKDYCQHCGCRVWSEPVHANVCDTHRRLARQGIDAPNPPETAEAETPLSEVDDQ